MTDNLLPFLDIEAGLGQAVYPSWEKKGSRLVGALRRAIKSGDERRIGQALEKLNFDKEVAKSRGRVQALMSTALLFGASLAEPKRSEILFKDPQIGLPEFLPNVTMVYEKIHTEAAVQYIKRMASEKSVQLLYAAKDKNLQKAPRDDVVNALNKAVLGNGRMMASIAANLTTSRLVSYGFLAQAKVKGISTYQLQAVLDRRTSQVCRRLHGRTFKVDLAFQHLEQVLQITNPEELKTMAPFVKGNKDTLHELEKLTDAQLAARGVMVPPFHPGCRTLLVKRGTVSTTETVFEPIQLPTAVAPIYDTVLDTDQPVDLKPNSPITALSTVDLDVIREAIDQAVSDGMDLYNASLLHDPKNLLALR